MSLQSELINLGSIFLPTLLAAIIQFIPTRSIGRRVFSVVGLSLCSVLVMGFGLMGLTRSCFQAVPTCAAETEARAVFGNMLGDQLPCQACVSSDGSGELGFVYALNQYRPGVLITSVALCLSMSGFSLVSFALWARRADPMMIRTGKSE